MMHLTRGMIEKVPFFKGADEGFVRSLVDRLHPRVAAEAELICNPGEVGDEMFFVHRGELDVLVGRAALKVAKLRQGDYFGEGLLINRPRTNAVRASTFCDLFTLTRAALEEVLPYYPQTTDTLRALVHERLEVDRRKGREAELSNKYGRRFLLLGGANQPTATGSRAVPSTLRAHILGRTRALKRGNSSSSVRSAATLRTSADSSSDTALRTSGCSSQQGGSEAGDEVSGSLASVEASQELSAPLIARIGLAGRWRARTADGATGQIFGGTPGLLPVGPPTSPTRGASTAFADPAAPLAVPPLARAATTNVRFADKVEVVEARRPLRRLSLAGRVPWRGSQAAAEAERVHWWARMGVELVTGSRRRERIVLPDGRARRLWVLFLWAACLWNLITWFYGASFRFRGSPEAGAFALLRPASGCGCYGIDLLADMIYAADIPLNLRLAYVNDQGILVRDSRRIAARYRAGHRMLVSMLSLLPLDWIVLALAVGYGWDVRLAYLAALLRGLRLLRWSDLSRLSYELYQFAAGPSPNFSLQRILTLIWSFFVCTHVVACAAGLVDFASPNTMTFGRHLYARDRCFADSAVTYALIDARDSGWTLYWRAIYFAMANLTGLGRDVKPESIEEHVLTLFVWFLGVFFIAFIVGSIGQLSSNLDASE
eukprot:scaffold18426_cov101-Isochrysis_galbana.AAC.1